MSEGGPLPGSRGNGLRAGRYTAVGDLDPRIADELLTRLRGEGIAAYVSPAPGRRGGYLDVHLPTTPTDRLFADEAYAGRARELLADEVAAPTATPRERVPDPDGLDVEAAWAELVRGLRAEPGPDGGRWPDQDQPAPAAEPEVTPVTASPAPVAAGGRRRSDASSAHVDPLAEEHFEPPPPPPVPRVRLGTALCLLTVIAGIVVLSVDIDGGALSWLGVLAVLGGAVGLVHQVRQDPRDHDDDGARV